MKFGTYVDYRVPVCCMSFARQRSLVAILETIYEPKAQVCVLLLCFYINYHNIIIIRKVKKRICQFQQKVNESSS